MIYGLDVSEEQGSIDWLKVAQSGVSFVYAKCGNGNTEVDGLDADPMFTKNVAGARAQGLIIGCYHFCYPLPSGPGLPAGRAPEEQAQLHFTASAGLGSNEGDLTTMIDAEWPDPSQWAMWKCSKAQIADWFSRYANKLESLSGRKVGLYSDQYFWSMIGGAGLMDFAARPFWPARPTGVRPLDGNKPALWDPFTSWQVWQWSQASIISGILTNVDLDVIPDDATMQELRGMDAVSPVASTDRPPST
jgi:lysozyme